MKWEQNSWRKFTDEVNVWLADLELWVLIQQGWIVRHDSNNLHKVIVVFIPSLASLMYSSDLLSFSIPCDHAPACTYPQKYGIIATIPSPNAV